ESRTAKGCRDPKYLTPKNIIIHAGCNHIQMYRDFVLWYFDIRSTIEIGYTEKSEGDTILCIPKCLHFNQEFNFFADISRSHELLWLSRMAIEDDDHIVSKMIIKAQADINYVDPDTGTNLLITSIKTGLLDIVNNLIFAGININYIDKSSKTALDYAN